MSGQRLDGRTALVTGAARGIGFAIAEALQRAGAGLALVDVDATGLAEAGRALAGAGAVAAEAVDVTDASAVGAFVAAIERRFGAIDILVNNAVVGPERISPGYMQERPKFWTIADDLWRDMLRVNVFGPQLMARHVVPGMLSRRWGRLINITTSLDTMYRPGLGGYGPCKAALEAHTLVMAADLEGTGVTANVLVPGGPVNTRMMGEHNTLARDKLIQPNVMQAPAVWLCSEEAGALNGIRLVAIRWDPGLPLAQRLERAVAPAAWTQLGAQAAYPGN